MDYTAIVIALIVAVPTVLATTFLPMWRENSKNEIRAKERAEDKAELKLAAEKAEEVAEQAKEAARLLAENTERVTITTKELTDKVDEVSAVNKVIHTLVNSKLTVTTQRLRDVTAISLSLMRQFSPDKVAEITVLDLQLAELDAELSDRATQAAAVAKQQLENVNPER